MKKTPIPGTFRLEHIRGAVAAASDGADSSSAMSSRTGLSPRHLSFAVQSASILGWLEGDKKSWQVTMEGLELLDTPPGSAAEALVFQRALSSSAAVRKLSPGLLKTKPPTLEMLTSRIMKTTGLAKASATRGARVLLSWRRQALETRAEKKNATRTSSTTATSSQAVVRLASIHLEGLGPFKQAAAELMPLTLLIGGTASGKSTFVDAFTFLAEALHIGLPKALERRGRELAELTFNGQGEAFGLALELWLPERVRPEPTLSHARYELEIGRLSPPQVGVRWEALFFKPDGPPSKDLRTPPERVPESWKQILVRESDDAVRYHAEGDDWVLTYVLDGARLGLAAVPEDTARFPATLSLRRYLRRGTSRLSLHPSLMRQPCSPLAGPSLKRDGSNIASVARHLRDVAPRDYEEWLQVVGKVLPGFRGLRVVERREDRHLLLTLDTDHGMSLPIHRLSDGTLRLLALALLPFGSDPRSLILVDEPTPSLTPMAIAALHQCWSASTNDGWRSGRSPQILVLTHSPLWARRAKAEQILCLNRGKSGETLIVPGVKHARLKRWRQKLKNETLFGRFPLG